MLRQNPGNDRPIAAGVAFGNCRTWEDKKFSGTEIGSVETAELTVEALCRNLYRRVELLGTGLVFLEVFVIVDMRRGKGQPEPNVMSTVIAWREWITINASDLMLGMVHWIVHNGIDARSLHYLPRFMLQRPLPAGLE
jgi:hypothetical protein